MEDSVLSTQHRYVSRCFSCLSTSSGSRHPLLKWFAVSQVVVLNPMRAEDEYAPPLQVHEQSGIKIFCGRIQDIWKIFFFVAGFVREDVLNFCSILTQIRRPYKVVWERVNRDADPRSLILCLHNGLK